MKRIVMNMGMVATIVGALMATACGNGSFENVAGGPSALSAPSVSRVVSNDVASAQGLFPAISCPTGVTSGLAVNVSDGGRVTFSWNQSNDVAVQRYNVQIERFVSDLQTYEPYADINFDAEDGNEGQWAVGASGLFRATVRTVNACGRNKFGATSDAVEFDVDEPAPSPVSVAPEESEE